MKKVLSVVLSAAMALSLCTGCSSSSGKETTAAQTESAAEAAGETAEAGAETGEAKAAEGGHVELFILGEVGRQYFSKKNMEIDTSFQYTVQKPTMHRARNISSTILEKFESGELDEVYMIYTRMENSVKSDAEKVRLLPLERASFSDMVMPLNMYREEIELYPSAQSVMDSIIPNYITGMIYGCLVEAYASEHNARMMAMQTATDSAESIIKELSTLYNRARQAAITQEITEVCSGANAQRREK